MTALWDTTGTEVVKALSAERRNAGGVASGLALTLVCSVDERRVPDAEVAGATAAAAHPCRLILVVRSSRPATSTHSPESRLDAEIMVGGRLGPAEAVVLRMHGRLARHAESVVIPLLAPDVPTVTWWQDAPPERIATDPLGVLAERRITDVTQCPDPVAALRGRAEDYAPGDTDLAWTRTTPWRSMLSGALDLSSGEVIAASVTAAANDATGALLVGWLRARTGIAPAIRAEGEGVTSVALRLSDGGEVSVARDGDAALVTRSGLPARSLPLPHRQVGDELAEELRRLGVDRPYAQALEATTGESGLDLRPSSRVFVWYDPTSAPAGQPA